MRSFSTAYTVFPDSQLLRCVFYRDDYETEVQAPIENSARRVVLANLTYDATEEDVRCIFPHASAVEFHALGISSSLHAQRQSAGSVPGVSGSGIDRATHHLQSKLPHMPPVLASRRVADLRMVRSGSVFEAHRLSPFSSLSLPTPFSRSGYAKVELKASEPSSSFSATLAVADARTGAKHRKHRSQTPPRADPSHPTEGAVEMGGTRDGRRGLEKYAMDFLKLFPDPRVLEEAVVADMDAFDEAQRQAQRQAAAESRKPDADGFIKVKAAHSRKARTAAAFHLQQQKGNSKGVGDFYRFQKRKASASHVLELRTRLDAEKIRIGKMKSERHFNPF